MPPTTRTLAPLAGALVSLGLLAGCGGAAEKVTEQAVEEAVEQQTGGDVDIDTSGDGSVEIETEDGSMSFGTGQVPEEWPEDVPLPEGLEVLSGSTQDASDGRLVAIIGTTTDTPEEMLANLKADLADWEISGESTITANDGSTTGAQFERDGRRVTFSATAGPEGETSITLGHTTLT